MEFSTRFPYSEMKIFVQFPRYFRDFSGLEMGFPAFEMTFFHISSTELHIKVTKPHFKLRKALFKKSLERNCKNKNVLLKRIVY